MSGAAAPPLAAPSGWLARLASPFAVGVAARIGGQLVSFALIVVAARFLSLDAFGTYALAAAAAVIATTFVFTGFYHALLRSTDLDAQIDTLFWLHAATGAVGTVAILGVALGFGGTGTELGTALLVAAPLPFLAVPNAWNEAQLVRDGRARAASLYVLTAEALGLAGAVWLLSQGGGLFALLAARYISVASALVLTTALVRRRPRLRFRPAALREGGRTALPIWGTSAIGMFSNYGADFVLAAYLTPAAVGAYRSGARIATTASDVIFQPLGMLSWSRFARLEQHGQRAAIGAVWSTNMAFACAMLWPAMAGVALLAEELVVTVFDLSWVAAAPVLAILCLGRALSAPLALLEPTLMCLNRPFLQLCLRLAGGAALLIALLTFGRYGAEAAAAAVAVSLGATGALALIVLMRVLGLRARQVARTFAPGLLLAAGVGASVPLLATAVATLPAALALLAHIGASLALWAVGIAAFTRLGVLELPRP